MDAEAKRKLASSLRGVSYDQRIDRFTAEIYIGGKRLWLGSFHDAQEASEAYEQAAQSRPPRSPGTAFQRVYAEFREKHGGTKGDGTPTPGDVLTYDGQEFAFKALTWLTARHEGRKAKHAYFVWVAHCLDCGAEYTTRTPAPVSVARGITRRCPKHVTGRRQRKSKTDAYERGDFETPTQRVTRGFDVLALVHDRIAKSEAIAFVAQHVGIDAMMVGNMVANWKARGTKLDGSPLPFRFDGDDLVF